MGRYLTWLHLSDLHYCEPKTGWDAARVLRTLSEDLKQMQTHHDLQPDFVFFTGDVAFGHINDTPGNSLADQFDGAERFFNEVRSSFKTVVPRSNFFLVPGNHDVNRQCVSPDQTEWIDNLTELTRVESMLQSNSLQWRRYMERLSDYRGFLEKNNYAHLLAQPNNLTYSVTRPIHGIEVGIAGFNSAWSCGCEVEKGKLWMGGRWQIEQMLPNLSSSLIKIALVHHPQNWLTSYEDPNVRRQLERDFDFCLHGHEHQEWIEQLNSHVRVAAGACYDGSHKENGYNFVRINLETGHTEIWLRHYHSNGGAWIPEIVPNKTNHDGLWMLGNTSQLSLLLSTPLVSPVITTIADASFSGLPAPSPWQVNQERTTIESYSSDLPPVVDAWVGRERELAEINGMKNGVVVVTGLGGQGKSTIVAKFLEAWRAQNPRAFWDWSDCREEGDRFHTQLIRLIEHLTDGQLTGVSLAEADTKTIIRYFFEQFSDVSGVIILDNVDHYVNVYDKEFDLGVALLVNEAIRVQHNLLFVITCRPHVVYASPRFHEIHLQGLGLQETIELFRLRGVLVNKEGMAKQIEEICSLTEGHALWLNLIAVQMSRSHGKLLTVLQELRKGHIDERALSMFKALWSGLNDRQQIILRCMAEVSYPETVETIEQIVKPIIKSRNQTIRAFNGLRALSLVVQRGSDFNDSKFDLHPLVRNFIRTEYPTKRDRLRYIRPTLAFFSFSMREITALSEKAPLGLLVHL